MNPIITILKKAIPYPDIKGIHVWSVYCAVAIKKPASQKEIFRLSHVGAASKLNSKNKIFKDQIAVFHTRPETTVTKDTCLCLVLTVKGQTAYLQAPSVKPEHCPIGRPVP
jgi:hypothetical protein